MSMLVEEPEYHDDRTPPSRGLHLSAVLSAAVHLVLWGSFAAALAIFVPRFAKIFEDFGTEVSTFTSAVILLANLVVRMWPFVPFAILGAAVADWWLTETLTTDSTKGLVRVWFWGNVALPILLAIAAGVVIAANLGDLFLELS